MADGAGVVTEPRLPPISASVEMLFRVERPGSWRDRLRTCIDLARAHDGPRLSARLASIARLLLRPGQGDPTAARIRACKAVGGVDAVEFASWPDKDIDAIAAALRETGLGLTCFAVPTFQLADPTTHPAFLVALRESLVIADRLGASHLIVVPGKALPHVERASQRVAVKRALQSGALLAERAGVTLIIEPVNSRVDHAGIFLDRVSDGLDLVAEVDHPAVRLLFDAYHSAVMGEDPADLFSEKRGALVGHVHLADLPGRGEPGSGSIAWPVVLGALFDGGYAGGIGLEYRATHGRTERSLHKALSRIQIPTERVMPRIDA